jgi:hypothetical protein
METILGWSLIIAAAAIILMLALLLASERELKRRRTEIELLRSRFKRTGADAAMDFEIEFGAGTNREPTAESAALRQQLQSSQADVEKAAQEWLLQQLARIRTTREGERPRFTFEEAACRYIRERESPGGHFKFPHLWPGQIPPGATAGA